MTEKELIHAMVEPEVFVKIEKERGRETRSSFVRRIIIRWYNDLKGTQEIEE